MLFRSHAEEANPLIIQAPLGYSHDISIHRIPNQDLDHPMGTFEPKFILTYSYEPSASGSIPSTSRIEDPSCFEVISSRFNLNDENVLQAAELALRNEGSNELWMGMSTSDLHEGISWSIPTCVEMMKYSNRVYNFNGSSCIWKNSA